MKIAFFALSLCGVLSGAAQAELRVGDPAPEFTLMGTDGVEHSLTDLRADQVVVVAWYPRAKTPGCTKECQSFTKNGDEMRKYKAVYFMASVDKPELNSEFSEEQSADFTILSDPEKTTAREYGVFDEGRGVARRWTFYIGKDGRILYIDKNVSAGTHGEDVAKKLGELKVEKK